MAIFMMRGGGQLVPKSLVLASSSAGVLGVFSLFSTSFLPVFERTGAQFCVKMAKNILMQRFSGEVGTIGGFVTYSFQMLGETGLNYEVSFQLT